MRISKRTFVAGGALICVGVVGLIVAGMVGKWPQRLMAEGFYPGFHHMRGHHGSWHGAVAEHILERIDEHVEQLGLSEDQKVEYERIRSEIEANLIDSMEKKKALFTALHDEMNKERPDINAMGETIKGRLEEIPNVLGSHIDSFVAFYNILDDDQKAEVISAIRSKRCRGRWHPASGGE